MSTLKDPEYEKQPLMGDVDGDQMYPHIPPPAYEPAAKPVVMMDTAVPLPTYEQSEKFEKEGVLDFNNHNLEGSVRIVSSQPVNRDAGSFCEFTVFFFVCFLFSWVGYLVSCCFATSLAAQSGAAAGLGLSLVAKTIFVEFQPSYLTGAVHSMCYDEYYLYDGTGTHEWTDCGKRYYSFVRLFFWILGFLGLFLFARGISIFCQSRPQRVRNITVDEDNESP